MKKTVYIRLKHVKRLNTNPANNPATFVENYVIEQLRNAAAVAVGVKYFRMDDVLTQPEADALCDVPHYEVTINK